MTGHGVVTHSVRLLLVTGLLAAVGTEAAAQAGFEVTNVTPSRGPEAGGTLVVISGSGFTDATQVLFGENAAPSMVVSNDTTIAATTPPGMAGVVNVTVVRPDGTATLEEGFGYGAVPIAHDDAYSTPFNTPLVIDSPGVLANDDPNQGGGWVLTLGEDVANGTLTLSPDGGFSYTPNEGFAGTDRFTYRTTNSTGDSNHATVTITVGAPLAPLPPSNLYVAEIRGNRVTLRWTAPTLGPTPTGYAIEGGVTPGSVGAVILAPPTPTFTFEAPTGAFYVRVHTLSGNDRSEASNEVFIFVNLPIIPAAPENVLATVNGDAVTLAWRNTFTAGEPTSLVLDVSGALGASIPLGFTDTVSFAGVPPGEYTLSLRATNAAGSSLPSAPITLTVPSGCSAPPLTPTSFQAYRVGNTIVTFWEPAASGPAPTAYVLNVSGAFEGSFPTPGRTLSGAVGPGVYSLNVVAVNPCGASDPTATLTVTIP